MLSPSPPEPPTPPAPPNRPDLPPSPPPPPRPTPSTVMPEPPLPPAPPVPTSRPPAPPLCRPCVRPHRRWSPDHRRRDQPAPAVADESRMAAIAAELSGRHHHSPALPPVPKKKPPLPPSWPGPPSAPLRRRECARSGPASAVADQQPARSDEPEGRRSKSPSTSGTRSGAKVGDLPKICRAGVVKSAGANRTGSGSSCCARCAFV